MTRNKLLTASEAAAQLGITVQAVGLLARAGKIPGAMPPSPWLFPLAAVKKYAGQTPRGRGPGKKKKP